MATVQRKKGLGKVRPKREISHSRISQRYRWIYFWNFTFFTIILTSIFSRKLPNFMNVFDINQTSKFTYSFLILSITGIGVLPSRQNYTIRGCNCNECFPAYKSTERQSKGIFTPIYVQLQMALKMNKAKLLVMPLKELVALLILFKPSAGRRSKKQSTKNGSRKVGCFVCANSGDKERKRNVLL